MVDKIDEKSYRGIREKSDRVITRKSGKVILLQQTESGKYENIKQYNKFLASLISAN